MVKNNKSAIIILILTLVVGVLSISSHSFWMDEAMRVMYSRIKIEEGYFTYCWNFMQVGLVHLLYFTERLLGSSEFALRLFNLPFLLIAAIYMLKILQRMNFSSWWLLLFAVHPIVSYYMNDTGPYISIIACSSAMLWHCFYSDKKYTPANTAIVFCWLAFGFSLHFIFGFAGIFYLCALAYRIREEKQIRFLLKESLIVFPFALLILYIAIRYMQHMPHGKDNNWGTPGIFNIASAGYCFAGMAGLGLPRNDVRMGNYYLITPSMVILVASLALSILLIVVQNIRRKTLQYIQEPIILSSIILGIVFFIASYTRNFQFRERHVIFMYPMIFILFVIFLQEAWTNRRKLLNRPFVIIILALLLTSSARLRLLEPYQKDDCKGAIQYVKEKGFLDGKHPVLTQGVDWLYRYYQISPTKQCPVLAPNMATNINELDTVQIERISEHLLRQHSAICMILTEKEPQSLYLYRNAEKIYKQKGYIVEVNSQYNTFKVIIIRNPQLLFSDVPF